MMPNVIISIHAMNPIIRGFAQRCIITAEKYLQKNKIVRLDYISDHQNCIFQ